MKSFKILFSMLASLTLVLANTSCQSYVAEADTRATGPTLFNVEDEPVGSNCPNGGKKLESGQDLDGNNYLDDREKGDPTYICNGINGSKALISISNEAAGANCINGGKKIESGLDEDEDDALNATEVSATAYICNGLNLAVAVANEAAGANCPTGGKRIQSGIDLDGDSVLDAGEVSTTSYVCNGLNTAIAVSAEAAGLNCTTGGKKVQSGLDSNANGTLDAGEVANTSYICNALMSMIKLTTEAAGANCANGGTMVEIGLDSNGNGTLDALEVQGTRYVCNGINGTNGLNSLVKTTTEAAGANCALGGQKVEVGIDTDGNGVLGALEVTGTAYICNGSNGTNGNNSLINVTNEAAGANCAAGGKKVEIGVDTNDNGVLGALEITSTSYVCNGTNGSNGLNSLMNLTNEAAGANCADGGKKIEVGVDTDDNGVLGALEITSTSYVCNGAAGANGANGTTTLVNTVAEVAGVNCANGGVKVTSGLDDDNNGVLAIGEVDQTSYVCNGAAGSNGANGTTTLVNTAAEAAGANCANGGVKVTSGLDDDNNGVLAIGEVDQTSYVCNGAAGANGHNTLVTVSAEAAGANCADGGKKIENGIDDDDNGVLAAGEIDQTSYVCNGAAGSNGANGTTTLVNTAAEVAGVNCADGGVKVTSGLDDDNNGVLAIGEVDQTSYVCNGATGSNGLNSLVNISNEAAGVNCPEGGKKVESGIDLNSNAILEGGEITDTDYVCNGLNTLVAVTPEPAGVNCANGGQLVESGIDADADNILDPAEVSSSVYVCNGINGIDGFTTIVTPTTFIAGAEGANCAATGGVKIQSGLDNGDGAGNPSDGILHTDEVDATSYACNGADGAAGSNGFDSLVNSTAFIAGAEGANCAATGGIKIQSGLDNGDGAGDPIDGVLHTDEVDATSYACNGAAGANGVNSLVINANYAAGAPELGGNCPLNGGARIDSGLDNGDGGGTAGNNILEVGPGEIDDTSYVCNA